jgi:hypothetical protein
MAQGDWVCLQTRYATCAPLCQMRKQIILRVTHAQKGLTKQSVQRWNKPLYRWVACEMDEPAGRVEQLGHRVHRVDRNFEGFPDNDILQQILQSATQ